MEKDDYDLIGFSVYIWNIEKVKELIKAYSKRQASSLGGPKPPTATIYCTLTKGSATSSKTRAKRLSTNCLNTCRKKKNKCSF